MPDGEVFCSKDYFGKTVYAFPAISVRRVAGMIRGLCIYLLVIFKICKNGHQWNGRSLFKTIAGGCFKVMDTSIFA